VVPEFAVFVDDSYARIGCTVVNVFACAVDAITHKPTLALTLVHTWTNMRTVRVAVTVIHKIVVLA
jgi:phosphoglycerate-specific signal transduction histidine kinase